MVRRVSSAAVLATALAVTGCGSGASDGSGAEAEEPASPVTLERLEGTQYVASQPDDLDSPRHDLVAGTAVRLTIDDGTVRADAGCNQMSGAATMQDGTLALDSLVGTEMGCDADRAEQDQWLSDFLSAAPTAELDGSTLVLTVGEETLTLDAEPLASPDPGDPDQPMSDAG